MGRAQAAGVKGDKTTIAWEVRDGETREQAMARLREHLRQSGVSDASGSGRSATTTPTKARDQAGALFGVSGRSVQDAKAVAGAAPDVGTPYVMTDDDIAAQPWLWAFPRRDLPWIGRRRPRWWPKRWR